MRKNSLLVLLCCFVACDNEPVGNLESGNSNNSDNGENNTVYFPLHENNYWKYEVNASSDVTELNYTEMDSLYVATSNGDTHSLEVNTADTPGYGTMSNLLVNGALTTTQTALLFSGTLSLLEDLGIDESYDLENLVLYDKEANPSEILYSNSGSFSQNIELEGFDLPISANYSLTNKLVNKLSNMTVYGQNYSSVMEGELILNLSIDLEIEILGISQSVNILPAQNVLVMDHYFAENIGLIKAEAVQSFNLDTSLESLINLAGIELDIPTSLLFTNTQELIDFELN